MTTSALLIDAAVVRGSAAASLLEHPDVMNLYADLPEQASGVAPWLLPAHTLDAAGLLPLPARHGVSQIASERPLEELAAHLRQLRYLQTSDGQKFYFRFADTRVLQACERAWPADLQARVKGPIASWTWHDRRGAGRSYAPGMTGARKPLPSLTLRQFEALIEAGAADRMALSLDELGEPALHPTQDADQFDLVEAAIAYLRTLPPCGWLVQRAVARQVVLTSGRALTHPGFQALLAQAPQSDDIDAWRSDEPKETAR